MKRKASSENIECLVAVVGFIVFVVAVIVIALI